MLNIKKNALSLGVGLSLALSAPLLWAAASSADWVLHNGQFITMDQAQPRASAIAIKGDRLIAVGSDKEAQAHVGSATKVIDLKGKTVIPGLIDAHLHGIRGGRTYLFETYWYDATSLQGALAQLTKAAEKRGRQEWVAVVGSWIPEQFSEGRGPSVAELTAAVPNHPAYVQSLYDYALVNQKGIEALGLDQLHPKLPAGITVERDEAGKATGRLTGHIGAYNQLFAQISEGVDVKKNLKAFMASLNRVGVTGFIDPSAGDAEAYQTMFDVQQQGPTTMRIGYRLSAPAGAEVAWFKERLAFQGARYDDGRVAFLGLGENLIMAMNDGVRMAPGFESKPAAKEALYQVLRLAAQKGAPVELHAYTDDSADALLTTIERVAAEFNIRDLRWSLAHLNTGSVQTLARMKKLGLAYSVQMGPYFEAPAILKANGQAVAEAAGPTKQALDQGIMVAGGTDATRIGVAGVWQAIEYQVTGRSLGGQVTRRAELNLSREQALQLYTANAAWMGFAETQRGSLSVGKLADLAVLDRDVLTVPAHTLHETQALMTFVGGRMVQQQP